MENVISSFFSAETLVFCIVVWLAVLLFRKIVEWLGRKIAYVFPDKYEPWWQHLWRDTFLPVAPVLMGVTVVLLAPMFPYPAAFAVNTTARVFFGIVAGGASGFVYSFVKAQVKKLLPPKVNEAVDKLEK